MNPVKRKVTYRLYPTAKQADGMLDMLRLHQQLYNACLEQRISAYKKSKKSLNYYDQAKELTLLRAELPEYKGLNAQSAQVTLKRLDLAYQNFFRRIKQGEAKAGFPRFKSYDRYSGWGYATHGDGWRLHAGEGMKNGHIRVSGIGNLKIRGRARSIGAPKTMEIQRKQGKWYASVTVNCQPKRSKGARAIGIDWGLETYATLVDSDGLAESIENPRFVRNSLKSLKTKQQQLSKKKKGSNNRNKSRQVVAKLHGKIANQRKDFLHKTTAGLVKISALIATEKLNTKNMSAKGGAYKKGLNREILSAAPGAFHQMLKCKAEEAGIEYVEINTRKVKPSQTCHGCGRQEKKTLAMRVHTCPCGTVCGRDGNAAKVILNWALFGNATGQELAGCGGIALAIPAKQETPSIARECSA
jgi:putative transposase